MAARDIDVDVHEGIVTLTGVVRTADERHGLLDSRPSRA